MTAQEMAALFAQSPRPPAPGSPGQISCVRTLPLERLSWWMRLFWVPKTAVLITQHDLMHDIVIVERQRVI